jgi:hypothetical protein
MSIPDVTEQDKKELQRVAKQIAETTCFECNMRSIDINPSFVYRPQALLEAVIKILQDAV